MSSFAQQIAKAAPHARDTANRRWIYVPYDRYTDRTGPLTEQPAEETGIIIVESTAKAHRRLYHKKKLVLLISNMRHFALEQAERGVSVLYHWDERSHGQALAKLQRERTLPELTIMRPAERELRLDMAHAVRDGLKLNEVPDTTWLSTTEDFTGVYGPYRAGKSYVMDRFYRHMRQKTGILMQRSKPTGGKFSFDTENRKPFRRERIVPVLPTFAPDAITSEVIAHVEKLYGHHFGAIEGFDLPVTQSQCDAYWKFAREELLPFFGPYEDAMRDDEPQLFHSKCSALINLGRLLPRDLISDVEKAAENGTVPLASAEGFIRQLLGWREFMRHVHEQTDGYRLIDAPREESRKDNKHASQSQPVSQETAAARAAYEEISLTTGDPYAGARPSALAASLPLSGAFWGAQSGMHCLDTVVAGVIQDGWSHHITRLMVLSNIATLCGMSPRELTDWFWIAYVDAYDWVVEPNVLGMSTYADGGITATKPYISGAAYIHRMSNYCESCQFDPKKSTGPGSCPFTSLYWTFLERNQETLGSNFRLQMPYQSLRRKPAAERTELRKRAEEAVEHLASLPRPSY